jgi:hypothetical protein
MTHEHSLHRIAAALERIAVALDGQRQVREPARAPAHSDWWATYWARIDAAIAEADREWAERGPPPPELRGEGGQQ